MRTPQRLVRSGVFLLHSPRICNRTYT